MPKKSSALARLEHRVFGWGSVLGAWLTAGGHHPALVVAFDDGRTRGVLLWPEIWLSSPEEVRSAFAAAPQRDSGPAEEKVAAE